MGGNFFSQPPCDLETLRSYEFFLWYHGKGGYDRQSTGQMTFDVLLWNVNKLYNQLKEEKDHQEEQARVARARAKRK